MFHHPDLARALTEDRRRTFERQAQARSLRQHARRLRRRRP
jgi:hypothetical protein